MLALSEDPENEIRAFARGWMKLLAEQRLHDACAMIDEPNCYGISWTPDRIVTVVREAFAEGTQFRKLHPEGPEFTDPDELPEQTDREVGEFGDSGGYYFDYDLALNHERSDLTAQFEFLRRPTGYAVVLHDLDVM